MRDFAGGIVVHASAGFAGLASVLYLGRRKLVDSPHNIPFIALGVGLLWFGWYGFNSGSELKLDGITALAFLNTTLSAAFASVTWLLLEWGSARKPHFVGLLSGAVAGLACITPACGYVPIWASVVIGIAAGVVCYSAIGLKKRLHWDDALDVWGVNELGRVQAPLLFPADVHRRDQVGQPEHLGEAAYTFDGPIVAETQKTTPAASG